MMLSLPCRAREALEGMVLGAGAGGRRRYSTVVMLDEIDMLMTRDQQVGAQLTCLRLLLRSKVICLMLLLPQTTATC